MTVALLDGDIIAYRAASVLKPDAWDPAIKEPLTEVEAINTARITVENWVALAGCDVGIVCLTGSDNFRNRVLPSYKQHRAPSARPPTLAAVKASLAALKGTRLVEGLEADDLMGILLTNGRWPGAVCVTVDKDLRTVPGLHLNPVPRPGVTSVITRVTPAEALLKWLTQTLTGDVTDGYSGCPGVGPAKAAKLFAGKPPVVSTLWPLVVAEFLAKGLTERDALVQARVARILHASDYDKDSKRIGLWHPRETEWIPLAKEPT